MVLDTTRYSVWQYENQAIMKMEFKHYADILVAILIARKNETLLWMRRCIAINTTEWL